VGKLLNGPLKVKLSNGSEISMAPSKFSSISYRRSADKPDEPAVKSPAIVLRNGMQVFFKASDLDYSFQSEYGEVPHKPADAHAEGPPATTRKVEPAGEIKLSPGDLAAIFMDTPEGGLHRAVFRNGSVLSGLLTARTQKLSLDLGLTLTADASSIEQIIFPTSDAEQPAMTEMTLRNENQLIGTISETSLAVQSDVGQVTVKPADISEVQFQGDSLGAVQIKLSSGATVSGKLISRTIKFKIEPGPELSVFVGHITKIICPPPASTTSAPATSAPATASAVSDKPKEITTPEIIQLLEKEQFTSISTHHSQRIEIVLKNGEKYSGKYDQSKSGKYSTDQHLFDIYNLTRHILRNRAANGNEDVSGVIMCE